MELIMKYIVKPLGIFSLLFSLAANSAIIDSQSFTQDSFVDTSTGLAWMDFGINNGQSYNYVANQLSDGGDYFGWRLPTTEEIFTLWSNVADLDNVEADYEDLNKYGTGQFYAWDNNSRTAGGDDSVWDDAFSVMGYNIFNSTDFVERTNAIGFFMGENGLASVSLSDAKSKTSYYFTFKDEIKLRDDAAYSGFFLNLAHENYSTMLVREANVPEPGTVGIFASALTLLVMRRTRSHRSSLKNR